MAMWTSLQLLTAGQEVHGDGTPIEFKLFLGGVAATATLIWFARGERDEIRGRLARIEELLQTRPCVKETRNECPTKENE
jgi:hypothetical protein